LSARVRNATSAAKSRLVALTVLVELLVDDVGAKAAQLMVEYDPQPPFDVGDPDRADGAVITRVQEWAVERD